MHKYDFTDRNRTACSFLDVGCGIITSGALSRARSTDRGPTLADAVSDARLTGQTIRREGAGLAGCTNAADFVHARRTICHIE